MIGLIARILKILNSETAPGQIGMAVALAAVFGLTPLWTLHNLVVLLLVLTLRVNLSSFIIAWGLFTVFAFALDPLFDALGHAILTTEALRPLWAGLYATDLGRLSEFNNTVVMGSLFASLVAAPLLWLGTVRLVREYRAHLREWVLRQRMFRLLRGTRVFDLYEKLADRG